MASSNTTMKNNFTTIVQYPNNINMSPCQNTNFYTKPSVNDVPELSTERTSSISSESTEEITLVSKSTSLNTTKLEEELNPFEQSFETSQSEGKGPQLPTIQHLNSVPSSMIDTSSKPVTFIQGSYHDNQKASNIRRNRKTKYDLEDQEKRKNFLERNRIAALKCRQRKKQWLQNLQTRVEYLAADNEQYYIEINALREELVNLKMLLLAHKECPMDQQAIRSALNKTIPTVPMIPQMMSHIPSQPN